MDTPVYEIVATEDGAYVLRRTDTEEEPVVTIRFSPQATEFLSSARGDVAKTMIEAGIQAVEDLIENSAKEDSAGSDDQTIH